VHAAGLPGRVPIGTLTAARRHLPAVAAARHRDRAWLYVAPCPGPGKPCTVYCGTAAALPLGRQILVILGEHPAARPDVAASALAHEAGHHAYRWLWQVHYARTTLGWGWAAAGLAGAAAGGWTGAAIAGAVFWLVSLAALWAGETLCDLRGVRTEGYPAVLAGFGYMAGLLADRAARSRPARRAVTAVLDWAAGPAHPPLRLRRALVRVLAPKDADGDAGPGPGAA
jgi:Zn-dependent protease with chaperone function